MDLAFTLACIVILVIAGIVLMSLGAKKSLETKKSPRQLKGRSMSIAGVSMMLVAGVLGFVLIKDKY